ncbi:unnamed protein product [Enterobius vermicularis]|uniref:C2H2-type domain-containing protein n=1 Tax=Enterobius vermicularis TaxID=51028 RepID=A0A0N4VIT0_ENTVE|nr:unnamed protein product [Enterobius vermicularis]
MSEPSSAQQAVRQQEDVMLEMETIITEDELLGGMPAGVDVEVEVEVDQQNNPSRGEVRRGERETERTIETRQTSRNNSGPVIKGEPTRVERDPGPSLQQQTADGDGSGKKACLTTNKFVPVTSGGPIPRDAKVVVLMKSNTPGEKPTFVKLEPVTPPVIRTVPAEFSRAVAMARRKDRINNTPPPEKPTRKRRIIPPITKKDKEAKKPMGRRGRPPKENEEIATPTRASKPKMVKTEPVEASLEPESSGRPKRTHRTPKRYGDFYEPPVGYSEVHQSSAEPGPEIVEENPGNNVGSQEGSFATEQAQENEESSKKARITADVVNEDDYDPDEDEEDEEIPEPVDVDGVDEGEAGAPQDVHLEGKEYEDFVNKEISKGKLQCERCHRFFANHNSMNAHRFKVHRIVIRASVKCPGCEHRATTIHTLNEHVAEVHGVKLQYIRRRFATTTDFQNYLDHLAATENMAFVRHRKSESKRQLYCNRSGAKRITKDPHIRNRPRKGTAKIGAMCPAHMFYTECDDGSIEVNGQLTHFGHTLDPRYVFPVTSAEKATARLKPSSAKKYSFLKNFKLSIKRQLWVLCTVASLLIFKVFTQLPIYLLFYTFSSGTFPLFLKLFRFVVVNKKPADEETFINVDDTDSRRDEEMVISETQEDDEYLRMEEEARLEEELGPVHPKAEEIDIRMKNIDRLCSFLFDNVSEQLYRLDDTTMDVLLRSLRTTQNSISNLSSMMIQIKEGDPNVIQKFQRRGPRYGGWNSSRVSGGRSRKDGYQAARRRQRQLYDTEDYDEDTVYYRHVPLRTTSDIENVYLVDDPDEYYEAEEY